MPLLFSWVSLAINHKMDENHVFFKGPQFSENYLVVWFCLPRSSSVFRKLFCGVVLFSGEEKFSYGFGGTAKASTDCKFTDFGETFGEGDAVTCYLVSLGDDPETQHVLLPFKK